MRHYNIIVPHLTSHKPKSYTYGVITNIQKRNWLFGNWKLVIEIGKWKLALRKNTIFHSLFSITIFYFLYSYFPLLTTPHALVGLYLATRFPPTIGLPAALISHFIFDFFFPHWNPHLYTEMNKKGKISKNSWKWIIGDTIIALILCFLWALKTWPNINLILLGAIGAFLAVLSDLIEIPYYFFKSKNGLLKKYVALEHKYQFNASPFWGILNQLVVAGTCLAVLF